MKLIISKYRGGSIYPYKLRNGFTLVELLAVIVILAVILAIAIPSISKTIEGVKKGAFESSVRGIINSSKYSYHKSKIDNYNGEIIFSIVNGRIESNPVGINLDFKGEIPNNGTIKIAKDGKIELTLHDGKYCATKYFNKNDIEISKKNVDVCIIDIIPPVITLSENGGDSFSASTSIEVYDLSAIDVM